MTWRASILTLFPEIFPGPLDASLLGKARQKNLWALDVHDIREHGLGKHRTVDDTPAGGGPGMVMRADVAAAAIDAVRKAGDARPLIYLSPRGRPLTQSRVAALAQGAGAVLFCARFEGLDERVIQARAMEEISLGDFVLAGGEAAALALIEACVRLIPGVLGDETSMIEESFSKGLLEHPHYTRPPEFEGAAIPDVLSSGNHARVEAWRRAQSIERTRQRRPDMYARWWVNDRLSRADEPSPRPRRRRHSPPNGRG